MSISAIMGLSGVGGSLNKYEIFTSSGTWNKPSGVEIAYAFLVGGGGSGARNTSGNAGGGGGGECIFGMAFVKDQSSYTVTIGAGGAERTTNGSGYGGGNTTFANLTANGGVGGQADYGGRGGGSYGRIIPFHYDPNGNWTGRDASYGAGGSASTQYNGESGGIMSFPMLTSLGGGGGGSHDGDGGYTIFGSGGGAVSGAGGGGASYGNGGYAYTSGKSPDCAANSGGGGSNNVGTTGAGGSGYCIVFWSE